MDKFWLGRGGVRVERVEIGGCDEGDKEMVVGPNGNVFDPGPVCELIDEVSGVVSG